MELSKEERVIQYVKIILGIIAITAFLLK